jgi:rubrerythrin
MAYANEGSEVMAKGLQQLLVWLRKDLMGEFEAINQYQAHIDNIDDAEVKALLAHIRDDEKEHVAELMHLITRLDEKQRLKFEEDHTEVR